MLEGNGLDSMLELVSESEHLGGTNNLWKLNQKSWEQKNL